MTDNIVMGLIYNAALLLSLSIVYQIGYYIPPKYQKFTPYLNGILIAAVGLCLMTFPFKMETGVIFDTRTILLGVTALIFGGVPVTIAGVVMAVYRILLGGEGVMMGVASIFISAIIGLVWRKRGMLNKWKSKWVSLYLLGIDIHVGMLACTLLLPWAKTLSVLAGIAFPVMVIYPLATVILAMLLFTQKERIESHLRIAEAEAKYKSLFDNNHAIMMLYDPADYRIFDVNQAACDFYGWPQDVLKQMSVHQINVTPEEDTWLEMKTADQEGRQYYLFQHRKASGEIVDVEVYSGYILLEGKQLVYSIVHDVSNRMASEKARIASENRFRLLVEGAPDAILIQTDYRFAYVNIAAVEMFGANHADQLIGMPVMERFHPDSHSVIQRRIYQLNYWKMRVQPNEEIFVRMDGTPVDVEVSAVPIHYNGKDGAIVYARDISERKKMDVARRELEAQMRQQQKLEAIGTLAGGVAHEINNPINGIMNYADLILNSSDSDVRQLEYAREIIHETKRVSVIVKNLLQFSRHEKQSHSYASIYDIVNQTISLIKTIVRKDQIELEIDMEEGLPDIKCRSQQIQQVLMNLMTNARDALNERYQGYHENKVMKLSCHQFEKDGRRWLRIVLEDHGAGIADDVKEKIFEPFFSTKPKEIGTGLGLSISYGIVKDHHGSLSLNTLHGEKTEAILVLPVDNGWTL